MRGKQGEEIDHKVLVLPIRTANVGNFLKKISNYLKRLGRKIKEDAKNQENRGWE